MNLNNFWKLLQRSYEEYSRDRGPRLSAALAYYGVFTMFPLILIGITVIGAVYGEDAAKGEIVKQISQYVGESAAMTIQNIIVDIYESTTSFLATLIGFILLAYAASGIFGEIQDSLNQIWKVEEKPTIGIMKSIIKFFKQKLLNFSLVIIVGLLFLVLVFLTTSVSALNKFFSTTIPGYSPSIFGEIISLVVSFILLTGLLAIVYKNLPKIKIEWSDVWVGSAITSFLFVLSRFLISLYLGYSSVTSAYAAAGAILVIMIWIYYSAQIFYFGAEITKVYAVRYGSMREEESLGRKLMHRFWKKRKES